jgi:hypothetical protein
MLSYQQRQESHRCLGPQDLEDVVHRLLDLSMVEERRGDFAWTCFGPSPPPASSRRLPSHMASKLGWIKSAPSSSSHNSKRNNTSSSTPAYQPTTSATSAFKDDKARIAEYQVRSVCRPLCAMR